MGFGSGKSVDGNRSEFEKCDEWNSYSLKIYVFRK